MGSLSGPAAPMIATAVAAVAVMLSIGAYRGHRLTVFVTLCGLLTALLLVVLALPVRTPLQTPLLVLDHYAVFYHAIFILVALALTLLGYESLRRGETQPHEYYLLLLLGTVGAMTLVASVHLVSFFLGLEMLSVSLYALVAFRRGRPQGIEGAIKYLILAGVASSFLLFGMALAYAAVGSMRLADLAAALSQPSQPLLLGSLALIFVGLGFKLALVPFHLWTPDVYEGAPPPVSAFIATVSKGAILALLVRFGSALNLAHLPGLPQIIAVVAILTMTIGNLLALRQPDLKRLLAYSSIAQMGYLLIALLLPGEIPVAVVTFYLITYFAAVIAAFGVITALSEGDEEPGPLRHYVGLAWRRPWLAALLTAALLSLAGLPLSGGFAGKFILVMAGVSAHLWALVLALVINSAISLYYYLRVVSRLYRPPEVAAQWPRPLRLSSAAAAVALAIAGVLLLWLGVYPSPLLATIGEVARSFHD